MAIIKITLTHEDFKNSSGYLSNVNCALAVAIKRQLAPTELWIGGTIAEINGEGYKIAESSMGSCPIDDGYATVRRGDFVTPFEVTLIS